MNPKSPTGDVSAKKCDSNWSLGFGIVVVVILLLFGIGCWGNYTESGRSAFTNVKSKLGMSGTSLKSLDVVMFMSPTCPWCKKMIDVLSKEGQLNNIMVVDTSKPEGINMAKQFGADKQPVPSFISRKLKTGTVGARESVSKLIEALTQQPKSDAAPVGGNAGGNAAPTGGPVDINLIQGLQIVMFHRAGCGWCTKAKEECSQAGIMDVIQLVDITTPEGQSMASELLPPGTSGVPAFVSTKSGKHVVGYKPIDQLVQELQ